MFLTMPMRDLDAEKCTTNLVGRDARDLVATRHSPVIASNVPIRHEICRMLRIMAAVRVYPRLSSQALGHGRGARDGDDASPR